MWNGRTYGYGRAAFDGSDEDSDDSSGSDDDEPSMYDARRKREKAEQAAAQAAGTAANPAGKRTRKPRKKETAKRVHQREGEFPAGSYEARVLDPKTSPWWRLIHKSDVLDESSRNGIRFRRKFRMPFALVKQIQAQAEQDPEWQDKPAGPGHGRGLPRHPLIMKVLVVLRHLASGDTYASLEDQSQIAESTLKKMIPKFIKWMDENFVPLHIRLPEGKHLEHSLGLYARLGFPGALCETDGVHLEWDSCPAGVHGRYTGKEQYPTIAFNVSALHTKEIIHVDGYYPGSVAF